MAKQVKCPLCKHNLKRVITRQFIRKTADLVGPNVIGFGDEEWDDTVIVICPWCMAELPESWWTENIFGL